MKIALINSEYPPQIGTGHGGIATYTYSMATALSSLGHTVHILLHKGTIPDKIPENIKIHYFDFKSPTNRIGRLVDKIKLPGKLSWEQGQSRSVEQILLSIYDNEGLNIAEFPEYGGLIHACKPSLPFKIVVNFHTPSFLIDELNNTVITSVRKRWHHFEKTAWEKANGFRCPSESLKALICKRFSYPESSITVIRNPVIIEPFDAVKKRHYRDNRVNILFAGRLEYRKGAIIILNNLRNILQADKRIHFIFAGETNLDGSYGYREVIERILNKEQRSRVWFPGSVDHKKLILLYSRSSIFLFPSTYENAPYALFEAMSAKLPVIATSAGGINEIITHRKNGLLFSPDKGDELLDCLKLFIQDCQMAENMSAQAYNDVKKMCSPEHIAEQSVQFYQSVISDKNAHTLHIK